MPIPAPPSAPASTPGGDPAAPAGSPPPGAPASLGMVTRSARTDAAADSQAQGDVDAAADTAHEPAPADTGAGMGTSAGTSARANVSAAAPLPRVLPRMPPAPLSLVAMPTMPLPPNAVGQSGTLHVTAALGGHGYAVTGAVADVAFAGVLASPGATHSAAMPHSGVPSVRSEEQADNQLATKRRRPEPSTPPTPAITNDQLREALDEAAAERPALPETIHSLLAKLSLQGNRTWVTASAQLTPKGRNAAAWMELDAHKRSMIQGAVRADEERFRAEQALCDAQIAVAAARRRRSEALRAAEATLRHVRCCKQVCTLVTCPFDINCTATLRTGVFF